MPSSAEIIRAMDEISNRVWSVIDSAELCRQTHPDREFVEEAIKASIRVNEYLHYLNTNHTLYNAVIKAEQEGNLLTDEAHRVAHYLRLDFERSGIHLSAEKVDRVNRLSIDISQLCRQFNQNIVNDPGTVDIFLASLIPRNLHHLLKPVYRSTSVVSKDSWRPGGTMNEKGFRITTDPHTLSCVLQGAPNDEVRKMAYIKGNSVPHANLGVLDQLIASRHELAQVSLYLNSQHILISYSA
ncbi:mitochondrial intermediate peptidase, mitochondrial-like [Prunus dulcis]|uniref:mitochondrial intermediate peptidase, mitochondrial-like n=1 Tax=Prunus dulcis TaxID=3755 RepID=UPI00148275E8|nr:mitochondrial intermediate peptidase, mitochondrial-like [Prunus dulcis]